jgi:hypothetical protein
MNEPIPDPYSPDWLDGPPRAEDEAYIAEKLRQHPEEQREEIAASHRRLIVIAERRRAAELASIAILDAAAHGADVRERVEHLVAMDDGSRVLTEIAIRLIRILGAAHREQILELLDVMRRLAEGEA